MKDEIPPRSWLYILNADKVFVGDVRRLLQESEEEGEDLEGVWQVNFYPSRCEITRLMEMGEEEWLKTRLFRRLRYYCVEWFGHRLIRAFSDFVWVTDGLFSRWEYTGGRLPKLSRRFGLVRHC